MVLPYLLACFGALLAGHTSVAPLVVDGKRALPTPATPGNEVVAAVAARMREHRAALDRVWGDALGGGVAGAGAAASAAVGGVGGAAPAPRGPAAE